MAVTLEESKISELNRQSLVLCWLKIGILFDIPIATYMDSWQGTDLGKKEEET